MVKRAVGPQPRRRVVKRFTDADKWDDPWFRRLSWQAKLAYLYILDNCDSAGVWEPDYAAADFHIGVKIKWGDVIEEMGNRVYYLQTNARVRVVKFIKFQYGRLSPDCKPHDKVYQALARHGIDPNNLDAGIPCQSEDLDAIRVSTRVPGTLQEEEENKDKDKEEAMPDWLKPSWNEWLEARKQAKRSPYTALGVKKQLKALADMGQARAVAAINYSIRQNYQGIFEENSNNKPNGNSDQRPNSRRYSTVADYSGVKNHGVEVPS
jgi:hypothetical protein